MKIKFKNLFAAILLTFASTFIFAQSETVASNIGDNFSLEGALELFKKAESPEAFEKALNSEDNYVNNLDLDEDGNTDYIRVIDNMEKDVHAIILQIPVNADESQDIAVIEIEKTGNENAMLQIIGDETIFGEQLIVEPFEEVGESGGKGGPSVNMETMRLVVNVWAWPSVRFVFGPRYRVWRSPYRFGVYPRWYRPWRPRSFNVWQPRVVVYRTRYQVVRTHRVVRAHRVYTPHRKTSKVVTTRTTRVVKTKNGNVVAGKKTTTVTKRSNGKVATQSTTRKGAVVNKNGKKAVVGQKKTTQKARTRNGTVTRKRTTTAGAKKGKKGAVGKKQTTKTVRKRRN